MKTIKSIEGKPLMKVQIPEIFQLQYDQAGKEAVKKVMQDYKGTRIALDTFNINSKGPVKGSNIYSRFALLNAYREITKENLRPINARESEIALANDALIDPNSTYEDLGLIVYPKEGTNPKIGKYLREQVKSDFKGVKLDKPFIITGLMNVVKNDRYEYELRLDFNELTDVYNVLVLSRETGKFDSKDLRLQKTGFPSKLGKGNRTLYIGNNGVRRFCRDGGLDLGAGGDGLANSSDGGRVNVVRNFSSENLEELVVKLGQERLKEQEALDQRFEKAKRILLNQ
jgi:hypothetical protein